MTVKTNNFEGGSDGATVTAANSGGASGDALTATYIGATSGFAYTATAPIFGTLSLLVTMVSGESAIGEYTGFNTGATGQQSVGFRYSFRTPATFGAITDIMGVRNATVKTATLKLTASGKISTYDAGDVTALYTTGVTLANSTNYDLAIWVKNGTTTSNGLIKSAVYPVGSNTPLETVFSTTAANTTTGIPTTVRFAKMTPSTLTGTMKFDGLRAGDTFTDLPTVSIGPPTGTATVTAGVVMLNASSYVPATGGGLTFSVANVSGPTLAYTVLDGWFFQFVPDPTSAAVYRLTVAETGGATATQDVTIPAAASAASGTYTETLVYDGAAFV